jgi:hypothetical protein
MDCVNATRITLPAFYIFKGSRMQKDYIEDCRSRTCIIMLKKGLDDILPFQIVVGFFLHNCSRGVFKEN